MSTLRQQLFPALRKPPTFEKPPALKTSELVGAWKYEENQNPHREAMQLLVLEKDGSWKEFENGLIGKTPAGITAQGDWWFRDGVLFRLPEPYDRHVDRGRETKARVLRHDPERIWIQPEGSEPVSLKKSSPEDFLAHTQHVQDEAKQIHKLATILFLTGAGFLITLFIILYLRAGV